MSTHHKGVSPFFRRVIEWGGIVLLSVLSGILVIRLSAAQLGGLVPVWLPAGVGMAALLRWRRLAILPVLIGHILLGTLVLAKPWSYTLLFSAFHTLGLWAAARFLRSNRAGLLPFFRMRRLISFLWATQMVFPSLASLGTFLIWLIHPEWMSANRFGYIILGQWLSDATGALLITPCCLMLMAREQERYSKAAAGVVEATVVFCVATGIVGLSFIGAAFSESIYFALSYLFIIPLLWMVFRSRLVVAQWLSVSIVLIAMSGVHWPSEQLDPVGRLSYVMLADVVVLIQGITLLVFGVLVAERRYTESRLRQANSYLEGTVAERNSQLAESESRFKRMADAAPFPLIMSRMLDGALIYANSRAEDLFKVTSVQVGSIKVQDFHVDKDDVHFIRTKLKSNDILQDYEVRLRDANGRLFWALLSSSVVQANEKAYVITGVNDITERKHLEKNLRDANEALQKHVHEVETVQHGLREQALRDPLTGLFNRRYLDQTLPGVLAHMMALHRDVAVLMVDADHFKSINDTYGHKCGDNVLTELGAYLSHHFRSGDIVCRYGGEEFFILLPGASLETAYQKAQVMCAEIREMIIQTMGHSLRVSVSVGVALCPMHGEDPESVVHAADAALYMAKSLGRDQVCVAQLPVSAGLNHSPTL